MKLHNMNIKKRLYSPIKYFIKDSATADLCPFAIAFFEGRNQNKNKTKKIKKTSKQERQSRNLVISMEKVKWGRNILHIYIIYMYSFEVDSSLHCYAFVQISQNTISQCFTESRTQSVFYGTDLFILIFVTFINSYTQYSQLWAALEWIISHEWINKTTTYIHYILLFFLCFVSFPNMYTFIYTCTYTFTYTQLQNSF